MITYRPGEFAISKSGHDKDSLYVIIREENEYVYLVDGKYRLLDNPKKKNKKHVQCIHYVDSVISGRIENEEPVNDVEIATAIRKAIKKFRTVD
ncbi:MAG: hypothetical protein HDT39_03660 [Lachnospiraceae bacterium]|nr:hypothetical protein [Lachnospiraceae bacterium]